MRGGQGFAPRRRGLSEQLADEGGDHPDDLRNCIANAIRHNLKTRTLPALTDFAGGPISGTSFGLTEYYIADVALAELQP